MDSTANGLQLRLTLLLQLEKRAREAQGQELPFVLVNETHRLIPYGQAALWRKDAAGRGRIEAFSGVAVPDPAAPFPSWLKRVFKHLDQGPASRELHAFRKQDLPEDLAGEWNEWLPEHGLWIPLPGPGGESRGVLALFREQAWSEADLHVLSYLAGAYGHSLALSDATRARSPLFKRMGRRRVMLAALLVLLVVAFLPMRRTVLAPAVVVARDPVFIRAPLAGVVDEVLVAPNQAVTQGQLLVSLEDSELRARMDVAGKALEMAREEYQQVSQQAIVDPLAKARVAILQGRMEQEAAELAYVQSLLERIEITAPMDGVAVFDDPDDWIGRPVAVGQTIMEVAEPGDLELEILLPAAEAIALDAGADVNFFLNVSPGSPAPAALRFTSYHASVTPEAGMAFRLRAAFTGADPRLRIGLRGTAKVYGERTLVILMVLHKPINLLRQWLTL